MKPEQGVSLFWRGCVGAFAVASLAACGGGDKDASKASRDAPKASELIGSVAKGEVNVDALLGYLPDGISISYEDQKYVEKTGLTTLSKVRLSSSEDTDFGLEISELVIAGLDSDFIDARIAEANFEQSAVVLDYLEARDVSLFGFENFYNELNDVSIDLLEGVTEDLIQEDLPPVEQSVEKISYNIDRVTIDDLELLPFELFTLPDGEEVAELKLLKTWASYSLAIGAKQVSMAGTSMAMEMLQDGLSMNMTFAMPLLEYEGWHGVDYKRGYAENMTFDIDMAMLEVDPDFPLERMEMSGALGSYLVEDIELSKAMNWLARGEMPPTSETDLMSFGRWTLKDFNMNFLGEPFYSIESSYLDVSQFHWLVPTKIEGRTENLVYNIGGFLDTFLELMPADELDPEDLQKTRKGLEVLAVYDLAAPSVDMGLDWEFNPDTGKSQLAVDTGLDGYGTMAFDMSGFMGEFEGWVEIFNEAEDGAGEEVLQAFVNKNFVLNGMRFQMQDRGGNDRVYDVVKELAEAFKDETPEIAAIAAYDKDTLKILVSSSIKGGAEFAASEFPPIRDYAAALADYLTDGGSFAIALAPDQPVRMKELRKFSEFDNPQEGIELLVDQLGFTVTHEGAR